MRNPLGIRSHRENFRNVNKVGFQAERLLRVTVIHERGFFARYFQSLDEARIASHFAGDGRASFQCR
jgi:hypothetical protein